MLQYMGVISSAECYSFQNFEKIGFKGSRPSNKVKMFIFTVSMHYEHLSYDAAVFQWITSCHKNRVTTCVITLLREYVTSLTTSVTTI